MSTEALRILKPDLHYEYWVEFLITMLEAIENEGYSLISGN